MKNNMLKDLVLKNRTRRIFYENEKIEMGTLRELVEIARFAPSANNIQPIKYILSNTKEKNELIFPSLSWAAYLKNWDGPKKGERPSAYIIILGDKSIRQEVKWDDGIVAQTIMLGAVEKGYGGCILGAINKTQLRNALHIPEQYDILLVLALGSPREQVIIDPVKNCDIKYWRDEHGIHHVPKRGLNDLILNL